MHGGGTADNALIASHYPSAASALKSHRLESLDHYGSQKGATVPQVQKEPMWDFLQMKQILAGPGNPTFRE